MTYFFLFLTVLKINLKFYHNVIIVITNETVFNKEVFKNIHANV